MTIPLIWIVEDQEHQAEVVESVLTLAFGPCTFRRFGDAGAVVDAIASAANTPVDLLVLDLLVPAGSMPGTLPLPGLDLLVVARQRLGEGPGILVRTGFVDQIPKRLITGRTAAVAKGSSIEVLVDTASSLLALRGVDLRRNVETLPSGKVVGAPPLWMTPLLLMAAGAVAATLWSATVLQVASGCGPSRNRRLIVVALVAGSALGGARQLNGRWRVTVTALAVLVLLVATLVLPSLC